MSLYYKVLNGPVSLMLLEKLRAHTALAHRQTEQTLIPRIKSVATSKEYMKLLEIFYGFFKPLESLITSYVDNAHVPDIARRRKADALAGDIHFIEGGGIRILPVCNDLPQVTNTRQAIGALYVMEGSTLGGQAIKTILTRNMATDGSKGYDFFTAYGPDNATMWRSFTQFLNTSFSEEEHEEIINAANETFMKFRLWAEQN